MIDSSITSVSPSHFLMQQSSHGYHAITHDSHVIRNASELLLKIIPKDLYDLYFDPKLILQEAIIYKLKKHHARVKSHHEPFSTKKDKKDELHEDTEARKSNIPQKSSTLTESKASEESKSEILKENLEANTAYRKSLNQFMRVIYENIIKQGTLDDSPSTYFTEAFILFLSDAIGNGLKESDIEELNPLRIQQLFHIESEKSSTEAVLLSFLFQVMNTFRETFPLYIISALQCVFISYIGIFYHFKRGSLSKQHIFRFRMRLIDFLHVFSGYFIENFEAQKLKIPAKVCDTFEKTKWRPFGGVIPFSGSRMYANKFPNLLSMNHGIVRLYLPITPIFDENLQLSTEFDAEKIAINHPQCTDIHRYIELIQRAITKDEDDLERFLNQVLSTNQLTQLHFPHKRIDFRLLGQLDTNGNIRVKPTIDLFGTSEELQLLLLRIISSELSDAQLEDSLEPTDEEILSSLLHSLYELDESTDPTASIVDTIHPAFYFLQLVTKHSRDTKLDQHSDLLSLYESLSTFTSQSLAMLQSIYKRNIFENSNREIYYLSDVDLLRAMNIFKEDILGSQSIITNPLYPKYNHIRNYRDKMTNEGLVNIQSPDDLPGIPNTYGKETKKRIFEENVRALSMIPDIDAASIFQNTIEHMCLTTAEESFLNITNEIESKISHITSNPVSLSYINEDRLKKHNLLEALLRIGNLPKKKHTKQLDTIKSNDSFLANDFLLLRQLINSWTYQETYTDTSNYFTSSDDFLEKSPIITSGSNSILSKLIETKETTNPFNHLLSTFKAVLNNELTGSDLFHWIDAINKDKDLSSGVAIFDASPIFSYLIMENYNLQDEENFLQFINNSIATLKIYQTHLKNIRQSKYKVVLEKEGEENNVLLQIKEWISNALSDAFPSSQRNIFFISTENSSKCPSFNSIVQRQYAKSPPMSSFSNLPFYLMEKEKSYYIQHLTNTKETLNTISDDLETQCRSLLVYLSDSGSMIWISQLPELRSLLITLLMHRSSSHLTLEFLHSILSKDFHHVIIPYEDTLHLLLQYIQLEFSAIIGNSIQSFEAIASICQSNDISAHEISYSFFNNLPKAFSVIEILLSHAHSKSLIAKFNDLLYSAFTCLRYIPSKPMNLEIIGRILLSLFTRILNICVQKPKYTHPIISSIIGTGMLFGKGISLSLSSICKRFIDLVPESSSIELASVLIHQYSTVCPPIKIDDAVFWKNRAFFLKELLLGRIAENPSLLDTSKFLNYTSLPCKLDENFAVDLLQYILTNQTEEQYNEYIDVALYRALRDTLDETSANVSFTTGLQKEAQFLIDTLKKRSLDLVVKENFVVQLLSYLHVSILEGTTVNDILLYEWKKDYEPIPHKRKEFKHLGDRVKLIQGKLYRLWREVHTRESQISLIAHFFHRMIIERIKMVMDQSSTYFQKDTLLLLKKSWPSMSLAEVHKQQFSESLQLSIQKSYLESKLRNYQDKHFLHALLAFARNPSKERYITMIFEDLNLQHGLKNLVQEICSRTSLSDVSMTTLQKPLFLTNGQDFPNIQHLIMECTATSQMSQLMLLYSQYQNLIDQWIEGDTSESVSIKYHLSQYLYTFQAESRTQDLLRIQHCWMILKFIAPQLSHTLFSLSNRKYIPTQQLKKHIESLTLLQSGKLPSLQVAIDRIKWICSIFSEISTDDTTQVSDILEEASKFQEMNTLFKSVSQSIPSDSISDKIHLLHSKLSLWKMEQNIHEKNIRVLESTSTSPQSLLVEEYISAKNLYYTILLQEEFSEELNYLLSVLKDLSSEISVPISILIQLNTMYEAIASKRTDTPSLQRNIFNFFASICRMENISPYDEMTALIHLECYNQCPSDLNIIDHILNKILPSKGLSLKQFHKVWIRCTYEVEMNTLRDIVQKSIQKKRTVNILDVFENNKASSKLSEFLIAIHGWWASLSTMITTGELHHILEESNVQYDPITNLNMKTFSQFLTVLNHVLDLQDMASLQLLKIFKDVKQFYNHVQQITLNVPEVIASLELFGSCPKLKNTFIECLQFLIESFHGPIGETTWNRLSKVAKQAIFNILQNVLKYEEGGNTEANKRDTANTHDILSKLDFIFHEYAMEIDNWEARINSIKLCDSILLNQKNLHVDMLVDSFIAFFSLQIKRLGKKHSELYLTEEPLQRVIGFINQWHIENTKVAHPSQVKFWSNNSGLFKKMLRSKLLSFRDSTHLSSKRQRKHIVVEILNSLYERSRYAATFFFSNKKIKSRITYFSSKENYIASVLNSLNLYQVCNLNSNGLSNLILLQNKQLGAYCLSILQRYEAVPKDLNLNTIEKESSLSRIQLRMENSHKSKVQALDNKPENIGQHNQGSHLIPTLPILSIQWLVIHMTKCLSHISNPKSYILQFLRVIFKLAYESADGNNFTLVCSILDLFFTKCDKEILNSLKSDIENCIRTQLIRICVLFPDGISIVTLFKLYNYMRCQIPPSVEGMVNEANLQHFIQSQPQYAKKCSHLQESFNAVRKCNNHSLQLPLLWVLLGNYKLEDEECIIYLIKEISQSFEDENFVDLLRMCLSVIIHEMVSTETILESVIRAKNSSLITDAQFVGILRSIIRHIYYKLDTKEDIIDCLFMLNGLNVMVSQLEAELYEKIRPYFRFLLRAISSKQITLNSSARS